MSKSDKSVVKVCAVIFGAIMLATIFTLPFFIAPFKLTVSPSFDYQFNNQIALLIACLGLAGALIFYLTLYDKKSEKIIYLFNNPPDNNLGISHYYFLLLIFLVIILLFYLMGAGYGYGEANYFLLRIDKIKTGLSPYEDFEYAYGVALIYIPAFLSKFLQISSLNAYYLAYSTFICLGLFLLYFTVNCINISIKTKKLIFYAVALSGIPYTLGLNYTLLRFITPVACLIVINRLILVQYKVKIRYVITIAIATVLFVLINFVISVEIGIALGIALGSYFYLSFLTGRGIINLFIGLIFTGFILGIALFFGNNLILILRVFASGGNNFPVIPSPSILLYIVSFLGVNVVLASYVIKNQLYFITYSLLTFNIVMLSGVFGRCDPGHVFWYGLSSFIFFWAYLSYTKSKFLRYYSVLFIMIFTLGSNLSGLFLYRQMIKTTSLTFLGTHEISDRKFHRLLIKQYKDTAKINLILSVYKPINNFKQIDKYSLISIPFDADQDLYLHLLQHHQYVPEYYSGRFLNVYTAEQIEAKLQLMKDKNHKYMIIPEDMFDFKFSREIGNEKMFLSILFLYPFNYTKKQYSQEMYAPVYNYIKNNYKIIDRFKRGYCLIERVGKISK